MTPRLVAVAPPDPRAWQDVVDRDASAQVTQTLDWMRCVTEAGPFRDASRLYTFDDGRRVLLPLAVRRGLPRGWSLEGSMPFDWGIGGPVADGPLHPVHARLVLDDLDARPALRRTVRLGPLADPAWRAAAGRRLTTHTTHVLELDGGFDSVWRNRFRSSVRRAVRRAQAHGVRVERDPGGARLLDVFDHLYAMSVQRWAAHQHEPLALARLRSHRANPPEKLRNVARRLGEDFVLWVAWHEDRPAAAVVVLRHGRHAKYWRGAMDFDVASPVRANDLLHQHAIEEACATKCRFYHLGDSRPGSGLATFKEGFGAVGLPSWSWRTERLPLSQAETRVRTVAKTVLRFQDQ